MGPRIYMLDGIPTGRGTFEAACVVNGDATFCQINLDSCFL